MKIKDLLAVTFAMLDSSKNIISLHTLLPSTTVIIVKTFLSAFIVLIVIRLFIENTDFPITFPVTMKSLFVLIILKSHLKLEQII